MNSNFEDIFVREVSDYQDKKVARKIWFCIGSKSFSSIVYLLKI